MTAQLLEGPPTRHLWAETYDRDRGDILKLQSEVADAIAQQVRAQITPAQRAQLRRAHTVDPAAYDSYVRGRLYFTTEYTKPDSLVRRNISSKNRSKKTPTSLLLMQDWQTPMSIWRSPEHCHGTRPHGPLGKVLARALELDDTIGEAYDTLGVLSWNFDWDWDAADRAFSRAIALAPSYSCALEDRAIFLAFRGRRDRSSRGDRKNRPAGCGFQRGWDRIITYYKLRDYPRLIEASQRGLLLDPNDSSQHYNLGAGYEGTGKLQEAIAEYRKAMERRMMIFPAPP